MEQSIPGVPVASGLPLAPPPLAVPSRQETSAWVEDSGPMLSRLKREGCWLVIASIVIALSFLMPTLQTRGAWLSLPCLFHFVTGLPCLFCGLTRSFALTAHGRFGAAFELHLLGPLMFLGVCAVALYMAYSLVSGKRVRFTLARHTRTIAFWSVLGLLVAVWLIKLAWLPKTW